MKGGNVLYSGDFVFAQFHLLQVNQSVELLYFCDQVVLKIQLF